ncbi:hypothetical protein CEXT_214281 [Caerostris extrusa]|uniref:Secreted protein n=1 Tax=Caerostris extrusa TaxID=172846 RepID=A0AAV4N8Y0_CAEEX|nr:hypothetical protein CEXT_214281 [Caerostris extrusa]
MDARNHHLFWGRAFRGMSGGLLLMSAIRQLLMTDLLGFPEQCSSIISAPRVATVFLLICGGENGRHKSSFILGPQPSAACLVAFFFNVCHQTTFDDRSPGVPGAVFINYFGSQGSVFSGFDRFAAHNAGSQFSCLEVITAR